MSDLIWLNDAVNVADIADYTGLSVEDVRNVTDEVVKGLKALQTVDAVPVVRCGECRHRYLEHDVWICRFGLMIPDPDGFCSYGER